MVVKILPEHVELPHVLDPAVHLVQLTTWMVRGGHTETFPLSTHFPQSTPSWLKVIGGVVAHVIIVSPQSQLDLDFELIWVWD